ncbi:Glycosyl transferase family 11 [Flavobacteriaceae bacterium MAR_2010_188]|nr:Glycosyl transferase family 11 [Flavobacteriaceae bacterium MAR_2010_188]
MIVVVKGSGNHSNRLLQSCHFEAYAIESQQNFYNPSLFNMKKYYVGYSTMFHLDKILMKLLRTKGIFRIHDYDNINKDDYNQELKKYNMNFVKGWNFRKHELIPKFHGHFKKKFELKKKFYINNLLSNRINKLSHEGHILVGVHIRRGDYKIYKKGIYYFTDAVYTKIMDHFEQLFEELSEKKLVFVIFSNEKIKIRNRDNMQISNNEWYVDHYLMSQCKYLIGPPSSFTMWASYIGQVPLFHLTTNQINFKLEDFKISDL